MRQSSCDLCPRQQPLLSKQIHWTDPSANSLYVWGGFTSDGSSPSQALWRFTADGSGGGAWEQVVQRDYADFSKLKGTFGSAFTQTEDVGYSFGGAVIKSSDGSIAKTMPDTPPQVSSHTISGRVVGTIPRPRRRRTVVMGLV